jgi:hypothetical protein
LGSHDVELLKGKIRDKKLNELLKWKSLDYLEK